jgi:spermidine synthase
MFRRFAERLRRAIALVRSCFCPLELDRSRSGALPPVRVVLRNGSKRLDGPTVNYSFGTLHTIFAEALRHVGLRHRPPRSVLLLGLGAGSVVALLRRELGIAAPIVAVELDPEVVRLATEHFGLRRWRDLEVVVGDAHAFVASDRRQFDLVVVDVFLDATVPAPFRQRPFLVAVRERLTPGGQALFNLIAATAAAQANLATFEPEIEAVFPGTRSMAIRSNVVFLASKSPAGPPPGSPPTRLRNAP